jgi:uncharacterized membrane protein YczE
VALLNETNIDPNGRSILETNERGSEWILAYVDFFKELLFNILWIIVVGAFIYVWFRFVTARGNPEEFKKAWTQTIYIVIWIALVSAAWWIVSLISGLDF